MFKLVPKLRLGTHGLEAPASGYNESQLPLPGWEAELLVPHSQAELGNEPKLLALSWFPSSAWEPMAWKLLLRATMKVLSYHCLRSATLCRPVYNISY